MSLSPRFFEPRFTYGDYVAACGAEAVRKKADASESAKKRLEFKRREAQSAVDKIVAKSKQKP